MLQSQEYYKLVSCADGRFFSAFQTREAFRCEYFLNEWTVAPVGGLLVFEDYYDAKFYREPTCQKIFKCICEDRVALPPVRFNLDSADRSDLTYERLWKNIFDLQPRHHPFASWPVGTRAFRRVKLLEEVQREN